jgi:hypothetical protein
MLKTIQKKRPLLNKGQALQFTADFLTGALEARKH